MVKLIIGAISTKRLQGRVAIAPAAGVSRKRATTVNYSQSGNTITETSTLEDGTTASSEITLDDNGMPVSVSCGGETHKIDIEYDESGAGATITYDGLVCSVSWDLEEDDPQDPVEPDEPVPAFDGILFDGGSRVVWLNGAGAEVSAAELSGAAYSATMYGDYFYTAQMVDLTDFDKLTVRFTAANDNNTVAVSKTVTTLAADFAASQIVTAAGAAELDVSSYTGEYYVLVLAGTPMTGSISTFTADKVWLE